MVVSAPASHLIGQALVSSDALLHDSEAKESFAKRLSPLVAILISCRKDLASCAWAC
jgi:hypothetical protein